MSYTDFCAIAKHARTVRTREAATDLLAAYAAMSCVTYPIDSALFAEVFGDDAPDGFVLAPYAFGPGHVVVAA